MAVISPETLDTDLYDAIETLIIANKPTYTRTIAGVPTVFTYDFKSGYPRSNPSFPIVVFDEDDINLVLLNMDGSGEDYAIEIKLDFYAIEAHGRKAISEGKQQIRATFLANLSAFDIDNGLIPTEDFWDDSNTSIFADHNQVLNTASVIIKFKLK